MREYIRIRDVESMSYFNEIKKSMDMLSEEGYIFLGQSVSYPGNVIYKTLENVSNKIELPVAEDMQMGMSIGLSLAGKRVVSIYPRMDFLICAMNQLANHLDKIKELSYGIFKPKVIIRTMIGSKAPLDAGLQHTGDYIDMLEAGLKDIKVYNLRYTDTIYQCYQRAVENNCSTILVEHGDLYGHP